MRRIEPGEGQESVWDYPRPPRLEPVGAPVKVVFAGQGIAESTAALRVLETSHPPTVYIPPADVRRDALQPNRRRSICEFKGPAVYWDVVVDGQVAEAAAWSYPEPWPGFEALRDFLSFYPSRMQACYLGGERVHAQRSDFYGGWITSKVVGPFKGPAGTLGW